MRLFLLLFTLMLLTAYALRLLIYKSNEYIYYLKCKKITYKPNLISLVLPIIEIIILVIIGNNF